MRKQKKRQTKNLALKSWNLHGLLGMYQEAHWLLLMAASMSFLLNTFTSGKQTNFFRSSSKDFPFSFS